MNVIFDMDGVIVNNMGYHMKSWMKFCENHGLDIPEELISAQIGKKNIEHFEIFFKRPISTTESEVFASEKESIYRDIFSKEIKPVPGLLSILQALDRHKIKKALATSAPTGNVKFVLGTLQLFDHFQAIVDETGVKLGKPDPQIFLVAAAKLGVKPETCIVFEDSFHGVEAAHKAGMKVIALTTTYPAELLNKADLIIKDFTEMSFDKLKDFYALEY
jgi:beta-phosphoglucomutase